MKTNKQVLVMTPASLRMNYVEELKKCGDPVYKREQYWDFINTKVNSEMIGPIKTVLSLSDEYIKKNGGAWMVNPELRPNYDSLTPKQKESLNEQINHMIMMKYDFINYNGLRVKKFEEYTLGGKVNYFDNKVVIIDEAHNLISRIVNKLKQAKTKRDGSLSYKMYTMLMSAQNCKIVLLSGTPMINYPNEIGILFNILRGHIKTWTIPIKVDTTAKINEGAVREILREAVNMDYMNFNVNNGVLQITRNPFGFINTYKQNKYEGVVLSEQGEITDAEFINNVTAALKRAKLVVDRRSVKITNHKALPDDIEEFSNMFLNIGGGTGNAVKNSELLMRRILGLTSYFRSAQEQLMPVYDESNDLIIEHLEMSDYQFGQYSEARAVERKQEERQAKRKKKATGDELYDEVSSTYRIFSRLFCNFVFPDAIERPMPKEKSGLSDAVGSEINENAIDIAPAQELTSTGDSGIGPDDIADVAKQGTIDTTYELRIQRALGELEKGGESVFSREQLSILSPKFLRLYENITAEENVGKHLIYSQFRTLEGIGIIKLMLEHYGFVQFRIKKDTLDNWSLDVPMAAAGSPMFALYTGTETAEEKEITRNVFNDNWELVPTKLRDQLQKINSENTMGELIRVFMITASGAEGISLKNLRFVHITEPYWHPVRREQVIGRAKRICSHNTLPEELRTVQVYLYIMKFSEAQLADTNKTSLELKLKDRSKDGKRVITTDEKLHETSNIKQEISNQLLTAIKMAAIDCSFHGGKTACYKFGNPEADKHVFVPDYTRDEVDTMREMNKKEATLSFKGFTMPGTKDKYFLETTTNKIYNITDIKRYKTSGETTLPDPVGEMGKRMVGGEEKIVINMY
jgi:hypothetical protein